MSRTGKLDCGVPERKDKCKLIEIYSKDYDMYAEIVRWCEHCGGVTVDVEYDNRLKPGGGRAMQFPEIAKHKTNASEH